MTDARLAAIQRRTLRVLVVSQTLAGAGLSAGIVVGALLAEDMLGATSSAGLPAALFTLGSALAAVIVGRLSQRSGRRVGLSTGYAVGAVGGAGVVAAAAIDDVALLLVSLFLYGSGFATNLQARYAGADLAPPERRGFAVSVVLVATTLGAVAGPNVVGPAGDLGELMGLPRLAGPFVIATAAYVLASAAVALLLRPDPLLTARAAALEAEAGGAPAAATQLNLPLLRTAAIAMVTTQAVMIGIMTMTPIHMRDHGHGLDATGFVISMHIAAMYLPSLVSGRLTDRIGRHQVLLLGAASLVLAGITAAAIPPDSMAGLTIALALLGLGWNLGLLAGTAMATDAIPLATRARTQGMVDLGVALSGSTAGMASGFVVAGSSYQTLSLIGAGLALVLVPALLTQRS